MSILPGAADVFVADGPLCDVIGPLVRASAARLGTEPVEVTDRGHTRSQARSHMGGGTGEGGRSLQYVMRSNIMPIGVAWEVSTSSGRRPPPPPHNRRAVAPPLVAIGTQTASRGHKVTDRVIQCHRLHYKVTYCHKVTSRRKVT